jgi:DNA repair exonuclease SbcCD ATPase subunit
VPAQDEVDKKDAAGPSNASLLDVPTLTRTPPPPFTEFAGVPDGLAAGEARAGEDPLTQDEGLTELTEEQKAAEEKRITFLSSQLPTLEGASADLQTKLDKEDDPVGSPANAIESDLEDAAKTATDIKARIAKKKFSEPPSDPLIREVQLANKSVAEIQFAITNAVLEVLLTRDDAGPMTIQAVINKQKPLRNKAKEVKDVVMGFAKRHQFAARSENATPGIINITF